MSERGRASTAHIYDRPKGQCIYCGMYQSNVEQYNHNCTPAREIEVDRIRRLERERNDHGE